MGWKDKRWFQVTMRVLWPVSLVATIVLTYLATTVWFSEPEVANLKLTNRVLSDSLKIFTDREKRWSDIEKTLIICYSLSKYQARYYAIIFDDYSRGYKIPWEIYPATIRIESNFKTTLTSRANCRGLMQVGDSTAKEVADKLGIRYNAKTSLWDEFLNLAIGLTYLSEGITESGLKDGVQRYVGGPNFRYTVEDSGDNGKYIGAYKTTVWREFKQISYVYAGVLAAAIPDSIFFEHDSKDDIAESSIQTEHESNRVVHRHHKVRKHRRSIAIDTATDTIANK